MSKLCPFSKVKEFNQFQIMVTIEENLLQEQDLKGCDTGKNKGSGEKEQGLYGNHNQEINLNGIF